MPVQADASLLFSFSDAGPFIELEFHNKWAEYRI